MTNASGRPLDAKRAHAIAAAFRPDGRFANRWNYFYTRTKLSSDPLYPAVADALRGTHAPLLDLGCGLGLLSHTLREDGIQVPYRGVDIDAAKIVHAQRIAARAGLQGVAFEAMDLGGELPAHRGSVALLDVLQYVDTPAQVRILDAACAMLDPGSRLFIRSGLATPGWRPRVSKAFDTLAARAGWMYSPPRRYPDEALLRERLDAAGLRYEIAPLNGNTPFNNWQIVARRDA
ncbi:methyltransferase domain-containing protein [Cognatilysobacter lacus]|uniref:Methyltransferase domain-containing protein n=1 Tax=Cognatilysobacter lacus TaxID=1643323 RepID=A0A5D8Z5R3_9GAMM|nr:methyltransferase domain-containing protein [Lysobacter lacus]TZF90258.1 methyltransferase domain-containing protein [Lysobacter lacus]